MNTSQSISKLSASLIKFHTLMGKVAKDSVNPHFKNRYASLSTIIEACTPHLTSCGLAVIQLPTDNNALTSVLIHESGEYIESTYIMPVQKQNDPQAVGSAITYARRYAFGAILSLNIDEDDDANGASSTQKPTYKPQQQAQDDKKWLNRTNKDGSITDEWSKTLDWLRSGKGSIETLKKTYKINKENLNELEQFVKQLLA